MRPSQSVGAGAGLVVPGADRGVDVSIDERGAAFVNDVVVVSDAARCSSSLPPSFHTRTPTTSAMTTTAASVTMIHGVLLRGG